LLMIHPRPPQNNRYVACLSQGLSSIQLIHFIVDAIEKHATACHGRSFAVIFGNWAIIRSISYNITAKGMRESAQSAHFLDGSNIYHCSGGGTCSSIQPYCSISWLFLNPMMKLSYCSTHANTIVESSFAAPQVDCRLLLSGICRQSSPAPPFGKIRRHHLHLFPFGAGIPGTASTAMRSATALPIRSV
jgi:hypothetical protein